MTDTKWGKNDFSLEEWVHQYYVIEGLTDIGKFREEATKRQRGDKYWKPHSSVIHFHRVTEDCEGREHETYPAEAGVPGEG